MKCEKDRSRRKFCHDLPSIKLKLIQDVDLQIPADKYSTAEFNSS